MSAPLRDALGICLGASSVSLVLLRAEGSAVSVLQVLSVPHGADPAAALEEVLKQAPGWQDIPCAVTGRKLAGLTRLPKLSEPEAVELAVPFALGPGHGELSVISAGGETFMAYHLDAAGRVRAIESGNKCASGTGEFLRQQLGRMALSVEDLPRLDPEAQPHHVSGRCSVFCKSDCTHALNKGAARESVVAGLGRMMAGKCLELLQNMPQERVLLTGGCAANPALVRFLGQSLPGLVVPAQAACFEALGAALWALKTSPRPPGPGPVVTGRRASFARLAPLSASLPLVDYKEQARGQARPGDEVVLGLDVGSTTTKGVLVRLRDKAVLAGEYLRTEGDPVGAARRVYAALAAQIEAPVRVTALGVTGSGRAIAALHAGATAAINEIVAHAAAAAHYDPSVDTIFEIGGQDAKYTFLSGGHPCDSAMNEACSAGTGSFLEEAARECLGVDTQHIARQALGACATPNFNDQCAAFIGSDIARAAQEGMALPEILAGLVHSVCLNYVTRVKGSRPVGRRVFMQGGVCYNRAVPAAMAMITGRRIVVPPEPGLMGALGVALEVEARIRRGLLQPGDFDLKELSARTARSREPFTCRGGKGGQQECDRRCSIARIEVVGKVHPFGGICNRFENLRQGKSPDAGSLDLVAARQRRVFRDLEPGPASGRPRMGMPRSYLVNTFFPLYRAFFEELGWDLTLSEGVCPEGLKRKGSALCYPAELSHGFLGDLLARRPDAVFLPHVTGVPGGPGGLASCTCVLLQGEPFSLRAVFPELEAYGSRLLTPTLDFSRGFGGAEAALTALARELGADSPRARQAFQAALTAQMLCRRDLAALGRQAMERLADQPELLGVVLFGRAYSAFAPEANKAVPEKLATRGAMVIPCDVLPLNGQGGQDDQVYWGQGRAILDAARAARAHPGLYGTYVTNFSCGPDSFLLGYFRDIMGHKPSLTLELDSHTADAGLETRLEAFLDIAAIHRRASALEPDHSGRHSTGAAASASLRKAEPERSPPASFRQALPEARQGRAGVLDSRGDWLPLEHERVRLVIPSMNVFGSRFAAAALARAGIRALALPPADDKALARGRANSSCKECLPLQLTVGTLLDHLDLRPPEEVTVYFMPGAQGPCRFGQYGEFTSRLIASRGVRDAAVLTPLADTGYGGLSAGSTLALWRGTVLGDFFEEMRSVLLALAVDRDGALEALERAAVRAETILRLPWGQALKELGDLARDLARLPLTRPVRQAPSVALLGEIFVRHDAISRQGLVRRLADKGIIARVAPVSEWVFYTDWLQNQGITKKSGLKERLKQWFKKRAMAQLRDALLPSGLVSAHQPESGELVRAGSRFVSPLLTGEAILTVGAAFQEMLAPACGVIALGPFGCMPTRLAEAVLRRNFTTRELARLAPWRLRALPQEARGPLPFLALETDGSPFPQLVEARLEAFCVQALRLHKTMARHAAG